MWRALAAAGLVAIALSALEARGFVNWLSAGAERVDWTGQAEILEWWTSIDKQ